MLPLLAIKNLASSMMVTSGSVSMSGIGSKIVVFSLHAALCPAWLYHLNLYLCVLRS